VKIKLWMKNIVHFVLNGCYCVAENLFQERNSPIVKGRAGRQAIIAAILNIQKVPCQPSQL